MAVTSRQSQNQQSFFLHFSYFSSFKFHFEIGLSQKKKYELNRNLLLLFSHPFFTRDIRSQQRNNEMKIAFYVRQMEHFDCELSFLGCDKAHAQIRLY